MVINFDFPPSAVEYVHRIGESVVVSLMIAYKSGRTGRAGLSGEAVTLFTEADAPVLRKYEIASTKLIPLDSNTL